MQFSAMPAQFHSNGVPNRPYVASHNPPPLMTAPIAPRARPQTAASSRGSNAMPGHGGNVHHAALVPTGISMFVAWPTDASRMPYRHDMGATQHTLRASCLPFERGTDFEVVRRDLQAIVNAVCSAHFASRRGAVVADSDNGCAHLVSTNPLNVVVLNVRKAAKGHTMEATVRTSQPRLLAKLISEAVVLADRKGFHLAHHYERPADAEECELAPAACQPNTSHVHQRASEPVTVSTRQQLLKYCETIRNLPQKQRHWTLDGLPCSTVGLRVDGVMPVTDEELLARRVGAAAAAVPLAAAAVASAEATVSHPASAAPRVVTNRGDKNYRQAYVLRSQMRLGGAGGKNIPTLAASLSTPPRSQEHARRLSSSASSSSRGSLGVSGGASLTSCAEGGLWHATTKAFFATPAPEGNINLLAH